MRTTFTLDDDVAAEVARLRREAGLGVSEAVNRLIRAGMVDRSHRRRYVHKAAPLGLRIDVANIGDVLDLLDQN